jgi:Raf kinase inhibitor-like YbhB/YbcL family protein
MGVVMRCHHWVGLTGLVILTLAGCGSSSSDGGEDEAQEVGRAKASIAVTSSAFDDGTELPSTFTCDGEQVSPTLTWSGAPAGQPLALVVDDPDAPGGTFVHWIVVNIAPGTTGIDKGEAPAGGAALVNDGGGTDYEAACPPDGEHRYRFAIYALPRAFELTDTLSPADAVAEIDQVATAQGTLTATYERP